MILRSSIFSTIFFLTIASTFSLGLGKVNASQNENNTDITEHAHQQEQHKNHQDDEHEHGVESILVLATRGSRTVSNEPIRVEVIVGEEIQEKALMRPGNISMLVAETGGVRVQTTSPALGSANIRLQGLYGRYTQLLNDGLPLYGGQASSIGLLQIPPTDLSSVEIIKGSASSLYGGSAMGGVINLVSRRPSDHFEGEALVNVTSRDGQDITTYLAAPITDTIGASFTGGGHYQHGQDFDNDGWLDMAEYERFTARPRLFWENDEGTSLYATIGLMTENRNGGTRIGQTVPDGSPFVQTQDTERFDVGLIAKGLAGDALNWTVRSSVMTQNHDKKFGSVAENDRHESYLFEGTLAGYSASSQWVFGVAMQSERFYSDDFSGFDYEFDVPGLFAQLDYDHNEDLSTSISARLDDHSEYGEQFSPRISILYRPNDWTIRASHGRGYFAPTPFVEAIEAAGLSRLAPLNGLEEETARTWSLDIGYQLGKLETSVTLFNSNVEGVTELEAFASEMNGSLNRVQLVNAMGESRIFGSELLLRYKWNDFKLTASYLFLDATEYDESNQRRQTIELTPRHSAGFVAMWEQHGKGRLGFEAYYTGEQRLDGNPFRQESKPYWHLGLLGEITLGNVSWFVNAENLLNIRQTRDDPLVLPTRAPDGQWTTDIWSRNDGFIVNAGVRVKFGG